MIEPTEAPPHADTATSEDRAANATWVVRPAGRYALACTAWWWVLAVAALVGGYLLGGVIGEGAGPYVFQGSLVVAAVLTLIGLWKFAAIKATSYALEDGQLRTGRGVLSRETEHLELYRVRDIGERRPFLMRLIGLGEVILHTEDRSEPVQRLMGVKGSHRLAMDIRRSVEACRGKRGFVGLE